MHGRPVGEHSRGRKIVYYLIPYAFVVFSLILVELILRFLVPEGGGVRWHQCRWIALQYGYEDASVFLEPHLTRFWKLKPNVGSLKPNVGSLGVLWKGKLTNSLGYRSPEVELEKSDSLLRILAIGDSTTMGLGLTIESTWTNRLEQRLGQRGLEVEVINGGVFGYTSYQGMQMLSEEVERLKPDLVIVNFGNNDGWSWGGKTDLEQSVNPFGYSALGNLLRRLIFGENTDRTQLYTEGERVPRVSGDQYRENLVWIYEYLSQRQIQPVFMIWPWQPQLAGASGPRSEYQEITRAVATERKAVLVDLLDDFKASPNPEELYIDPVHGSDPAQEVAARALARAIFASEPQALTY